MTVHMRPEEIGSPLEQATRIVLGMPQLCPNGLSENWLWKELGHRHWELIGQAVGRAAAGFGPAEVQPTYAAFKRIALREGDLGIVGENDVLDLRSTLTSLSETRVASRHLVACRNRLVADVEMVSVFVRRQTSGVNRSIVRVRIDNPHGGVAVSARAPAAPNRIEASDLLAEEREIGSLLIEPCPHLDFNGAGLLYFSSFIAAVDRAEWHLMGKGKPLTITRERQAIFHANIEVGDDLTVRLLATTSDATRHHRAVITAVSDGRLLADIMTER